MIRRVIPALLLASLAVIGGGWEAQACSCDALSPAQALKAADVAFSGLVTAVVDGPALTDPRTVTVDVDVVYKGAVPAVAFVETDPTGDTCGIDFVPSQRYTVFAQRVGARLTSGICDATAADPDLLDTVADGRPPDDPVRGRASGGRGFPLAGALVLAVGAAAGITAIRHRRQAP